jgi:hypothetical protein
MAGLHPGDGRRPPAAWTTAACQAQTGGSTQNRRLFSAMPPGGMSWAFVLEPLDQERTRLVSRIRATYDNLAFALFLKVFWIRLTSPCSASNCSI